MFIQLSDDNCRAADDDRIWSAGNLHYLVSDATGHLEIDQYGLAADYDNATHVRHSPFDYGAGVRIYQRSPSGLETDQNSLAPGSWKERRAVTCHISNPSSIRHNTLGYNESLHPREPLLSSKQLNWSKMEITIYTFSSIDQKPSTNVVQIWSMGDRLGVKAF